MYWITNLWVWSSVEGHHKESCIGEVIIWSIFNLLHSPYGYIYVLTKIVLSNWRSFYVFRFFIFYVRGHQLLNMYLILSILNMAISKQSYLFLIFKTWAIILYNKFWAHTSKMNFKKWISTLVLQTLFNFQH